MTRRVRVIGCGNLDAGDDALGILAVREARARLTVLPSVEVVEVSTGLNVLDLLAGVEAAVVVDAVRAPRGDRRPGTLVRIEAGPDGLPAELRSSLSSHGLGVAEAIGLASVLGPAPRVVVLGIEVAGVEAGSGLSPAVRSALPQLVRQIVSDAEVLAGAGPEGGRP